MSESENVPHEPSRLSSVDAEVKQVLLVLRQDNFTDGFEDRALERWNRERTASSNTLAFIERRAWQLLPLAIAASLILAVYSARHNATPNASLIARTLGWKSATTVASNNAAASDTYESVYTSLYGLPLVNSSSGAR